MITHSGSDGLELHLTKRENAAFEKERQELYIKYYGIQRTTRGVWAGNQGKFVSSRDELNEWDGDFMENLWEKTK